MKKNYHAQCEQDRIVDFALAKKTNGVFVDIGAHDGVTLSNTLFFEQERLYTGLCIEPNPDVFARLIRNRHCSCENYAIAEKDKQLTYRKIKGHYLVEMLGGILEFMSDEHIQHIQDSIKVYGGEIEDFPIQCRNINNMLRNNKITDIDFLYIDTEGAEVLILKSIDFSYFKIRLMSVEDNHKKEVDALLKAHGYSSMSYKLDSFYYKEISIGRRLWAVNIFSLFPVRVVNKIAKILKGLIHRSK
jgi:FkbM family methyltransferase